MIISKDILVKLNENRDSNSCFRFTTDTGQEFYILTKEQFEKLEKKND